EEIIENRAHAYYKNNGRYFEPKSLTHCIGAGGVGSTIVDLQKWSNVFLSSNHKFSYLKRFITELDTLNNGIEMKHARGMFVSPYKGLTTFNHSGRDLGMRAQFICVPEKNIAVIVYSNSEDINAVNISYELLDLFIDQGAVSKPSNGQFKHSPSQNKQFEGVFQELNSDLRMDFFIENDTLKVLSSFGRNAIPLVSESANSLCRKDNRSIVYTFQKEAISGVDLTVDFGGAIFYFERIELDPNPNKDLEEFVGIYHSDELNVTYSISIENNQLVLNYPNNQGLQLREGVTDTFGANRRTKYSFNRNKNGEVVSFVLASEGTVKDVFFEKTN
ncbi:MAG: serine hydrolase, partial [Flavobacteriales bacterium]